MRQRSLATAARPGRCLISPAATSSTGCPARPTPPRTGCEMAVEGKHALVTGGGSGIGAAIARALAQAGAHVTICGRRKEPLEETAAGSAGIFAMTADVT